MKGSVAEWFAIINSGHSKAPRVMVFLRFLVLISMKHNFLVRARHVPGAKNEIADALSRFQVQRFRELAPICRPQPLPSEGRSSYECKLGIIVEYQSYL